MTQELRIHLVTWNVADQGPPPPGRLELSKFIQYDSATPADVCAIGLQEVRKSSDWAALLAKEVAKCDYVLARSIQMHSIVLYVYVLRKHLPFVTNVETQYTRTAFGGLLGHKGAVSFRADLYGVNVAIVNCHLCAFDEKFSERIENYNVIIAGQTFKDKYVENILDHDYVFWIGDLNFRIDDLGRDEIIERIERNDYNTMLRNDQLIKARQEELIFLDFEEGTINFPPTYKFDVGSNTYDSGPKCRKPAWCDRILYMVHEDAFMELSTLALTSAEGHVVDPRLCVQQLVYTSIMDYLYSDHKPVLSQCLIKVFSVVPAVVFEDPQGWQCSNDAVVRYRVIEIPTSTWDYIALFKADFFTLDEYVTYVYASAKNDSATASVSTVNVCTAKFPASALKEPGLYRLCYISAGKKFIRGMSNAFEVQPKYVLAPLPPVSEESAAMLEAVDVVEEQLASAAEQAVYSLRDSYSAASRIDTVEVFADASAQPAVQEFPARAWVPPPGGAAPVDLSPEALDESKAAPPPSIVAADAVDAGTGGGSSSRIHPGMSIQELKVVSAELRQEQRRKQSAMSLLMAKASKLSARLPGVSLVFPQPRIVEEQSSAEQSRLPNEKQHLQQQQQQSSAAVRSASPAKRRDESTSAEQQQRKLEVLPEKVTVSDTAAATIPHDVVQPLCLSQPCVDQAPLPMLLHNRRPSSEESREPQRRSHSPVELRPLLSGQHESLPRSATSDSSEHSAPLQQQQQQIQPLPPPACVQPPAPQHPLVAAAHEPSPSSREPHSSPPPVVEEQELQQPLIHSSAAAAASAAMQQKEEDSPQPLLQSSHTAAASMVTACSAPTVLIEGVAGSEAPRVDSTAHSRASIIEPRETGSYVTVLGVDSAVATAALCQQKQQQPMLTGASDASHTSIAAAEHRTVQAPAATAAAPATEGPSGCVTADQAASPATAAAPTSLGEAQLGASTDAGGGAATDSGSCETAATSSYGTAVAAAHVEGRRKAENDAGPEVGVTTAGLCCPTPSRDSRGSSDISEQPRAIAGQLADRGGAEGTSQVAPARDQHAQSTVSLESSNASSNGSSSITPADATVLPGKAAMAAAEKPK